MTRKKNVMQNTAQHLCLGSSQTASCHPEHFAKAETKDLITLTQSDYLKSFFGDEVLRLCFRKMLRMTGGAQPK
jgi:hypothetical protein